jgi:hypothetical protein
MNGGDEIPLLAISDGVWCLGLRHKWKPVMIGLEGT